MADTAQKSTIKPELTFTAGGDTYTLSGTVENLLSIEGALGRSLGALLMDTTISFTDLIKVLRHGAKGKQLTNDKIDYLIETIGFGDMKWHVQEFIMLALCQPEDRKDVGKLIAGQRKSSEALH